MRRVDRIWDPCPEGEIRRMVGVLRGTHHRRLFARFLIAASVLVISGTIGMLYRFLQ